MSENIVWSHVKSNLPQISRFKTVVNGKNYLLVLTLSPTEYEINGLLAEIEYSTERSTHFANVVRHVGARRYRKGLKAVLAGSVEENRQDQLRAVYDRFFQEWAESLLAEQP